MTENNVPEPYGTLEYSSNNSGGSWWLKDADWYAMEKAGWTVRWKKDETDPWFTPDKDGRWLGALAMSAEIVVASLAEAKDKIREWEHITGQDVTDEGCTCCGPPHDFHIIKADGEWEDPISIRRWSRWD